MMLCVVFFFQAEDGIRDVAVTGVQTCALPISTESDNQHRRADENRAEFQTVHVSSRNAAVAALCIFWARRGSLRTARRGSKCLHLARALYRPAGRTFRNCRQFPPAVGKA